MERQIPSINNMLLIIINSLYIHIIIKKVDSSLRAGQNVEKPV